MKALSKLIKSRPSTFKMTLAFSGHLLVNQGLHLFISFIAFSNTLTHLDITYCVFSVKELEMFSVALSASTSLKSLAFANCSINGDGFELLSNELRENHTLLGLDLRKNCIGTNGVAALSSMLAVKTSLKILYLSHNEEMGQVGVL